MANSKEAYYFSHDSNARQDEKILALRMKHGWEGYGIFWALVEKLRESTDYKLVKNYNLLAFDLRIGADKVKSIIEDFGLFAFEDECFYSERMIDNMNLKSERAKKAANKRWGNNVDNQADNANAMQMHSNRNATAMLKDAIKGKESKEKKSKDYDAGATKFLLDTAAGFAKQCMTDEVWKETVAMQNKVPKSKFRETLWAFCKHCATEEKKHPNLKDFKSHFKNWSRKQDFTPKPKNNNNAIPAEWLS